MHKITTLCNILQLLSDYNEIKDEDAQDDARLAPEAIVDQRMPEEREVEDTSHALIGSGHREKKKMRMVKNETKRIDMDETDLCLMPDAFFVLRACPIVGAGG